jgi:PAS domain S-box-containing protein
LPSSTKTEPPDVLELIHASIFLRDFDGRIVYWNKASEELYGWRSDEAIGRSAHELLGSRHSESLTELEARLRIEGRWQGDLARTTAAGADVLIEACWSIRRNGAGTPIDIVETGRDITARKRTEQALMEAECRYRNLFQAMAASFWEIDFSAVGAMIRDLHKAGVRDLRYHFEQHPDLIRAMMRATRIIDVNDQAVTLFGRGRKQALLSTAEFFWPEASNMIYAESVIAAVTGKPNYTCETTLRTIEGREFDALFTACFDPASVKHGKITIGVIDISERKQVYAALQQSESRYRNLFQAMAVAFLQIDSMGLNARFSELRAQGVTDLSSYIDEHPEFIRQAMDLSIIVDVNQRAVRLYGARDRSEMLGPVTRFWNPDNSDAFRRSIEAGFRREPGYQAETKSRAVDGREIDVLFFVTAPPEMRDRGVVLVGNIDISEQVAARREVERMRADLAHASRVSVLGELTASIAHEIIQPLAAIAAHGEAGLRWLSRPEPDIEEVRALTTRVVADARRAAEVIARTRAMAGRRVPEPEYMMINSVLEEAIAFLRHELQTQRIELVLDLCSPSPHIRADRVQLQQVIVNLTVNAIQAMALANSAKRQLIIRSAEGDGGTVVVAVKDSGPGIAPNHLEHLFDSFFTTKPGGMGMGLPICRSIIEGHGGTIRVTSSASTGGAQFSFTLPDAGVPGIGTPRDGART